MKRFFLSVGLVCLLIFSCSKKDPMNELPSNLSDTSQPTPKNLTGEQIIMESDCSACHSTDERMIGPSYKEIAEKYSEKDIEMLASKIIEGGSGNWGNMPMSSHPLLSKEESKKIVEYILSQKK